MPRIQRRQMIALAALAVAVSAVSGLWVETATRQRELLLIESSLGSSARTVAELVRELPFEPTRRSDLSELAARAARAETFMGVCKVILPVRTALSAT